MRRGIVLTTAGRLDNSHRSELENGPPSQGGGVRSETEIDAMGRRFRYADVSAYRTTAGVRKRRATMGNKEKGWWIEYPPFLLFVRWRPWGGFMPCVLTQVGWDRDTQDFEFPNLWSAKMKRLTSGVGAGEKLPPLSPDSKIFTKFPRYREFMSAREYEDGSPRVPGRIWLDSDNLAYTAVIFERSGFGRMRFRAQSQDDLYVAIEAFLSQETPQWEDDDYAREKAAEKNVKKKHAK